MEIKFSSIHSIDLDQGSVNYRDHKNDFEEALSRMLQQINMQENLKKYIEKSQDTLVLKTAKEVCKKIYKNELDINSFNKYAYKIAYHLLEIELFLDIDNKKQLEIESKGEVCYKQLFIMKKRNAMNITFQSLNMLNFIVNWIL